MPLRACLKVPVPKWRITQHPAPVKARPALTAVTALKHEWWRGADRRSGEAQATVRDARWGLLQVRAGCPQRVGAMADSPEVPPLARQSRRRRTRCRWAEGTRAVRSSSGVGTDGRAGARRSARGWIGLPQEEQGATEAAGADQGPQPGGRAAQGVEQPLGYRPSATIRISRRGKVRFGRSTSRWNALCSQSCLRTPHRPAAPSACAGRSWAGGRPGCAPASAAADTRFSRVRAKGGKGWRFWGPRPGTRGSYEQPPSYRWRCNHSRIRVAKSRRLHSAQRLGSWPSPSYTSNVQVRLKRLNPTNASPA